jgi:hypothetical protein
MASVKERVTREPGSDFHFVRAGKRHFFCPLCKFHQSTSTIDRVHLKHHGQILLFTASLSLLFFPLVGWNGALLYLPTWAAFEFFYRLRKRQALICQSCGFDPFLYKQDVHRARKALKSHWESRIEKENLFANLKLKNYQTARVKKEEKNLAENIANRSEGLKNPESESAKSP